MKPSTLWRPVPGRQPLLALLKRIWNSDSRASAIVEMAVVLPLMLLLITGMMSMGVVLNNYLLLAHASDVGARYLAINQGNFTANATQNPCIMAATQIQNAAVAIPASSLSYAITITPTAGGTATTFTSLNGTGSYASASGCGATGTTGGVGAMGIGGGTVTVSVSYPVTPIVIFWAHHTINMTATTTEIIQ
jgi:Flp pilus assembly protein TadG